jgi:hypothetical protein
LGDGDQQAYKYAHTYPTLFSLVSNGKINQAPQPGDVISMADVSSFNGADGGHVAIVQSVSSGVASTGTGTINLIDQNDASTGLLSLTISGWSIKSWNGYSYFEWLHPKVGPTAYGYCATEGQHCSFTGLADVAYGADGRFRFIYAVNGGIDCNNTVFGDPDPGVHKACYMHPDVGPTGYTFCATEGQRCSFTGIAEVAYGADGKFYFTYASLWIDCNNTVFGDPDPGVHKACYIAP